MSYPKTIRPGERSVSRPNVRHRKYGWTMLNRTEYTSQIQPICESIKDNDDNVNPGWITPVYGCKKIGRLPKSQKNISHPSDPKKKSNLATRHGKHTWGATWNMAIETMDLPIYLWTIMFLHNFFCLFYQRVSTSRRCSFCNLLWMSKQAAPWPRSMLASGYRFRGLLWSNPWICAAGCFSHKFW